MASTATVERVAILEGMKLAACCKAHVRWLALAVLVLLVGACGVRETPTLVKEPLDLTILHTGKVYGEIAPCG